MLFPISLDGVSDRSVRGFLRFLCFDKTKPSARVGRKAMGLEADSRVAEVKGDPAFFMLCISNQGREDSPNPAFLKQREENDMCRRHVLLIASVLVVFTSLFTIFPVTQVTVYADTIYGTPGDDVITLDFNCDGIIGGAGNDIIMIEGWASIHAEDYISDEALGVSWIIDGAVVGDASGTALSDSGVSASAEATGISGGAGTDGIINFGEIVANAAADITAVGVSVDIGITAEGTAEGGALSDAGVTAASMATGIDGGDDSDDIDNRGAITLFSSSEATGVAVSLDVAGTMKGDAQGKAVSDASVTADATATGIDGGAGDDTIVNEGTITLMNGAGDDAVDASATAVSAGLEVAGTLEGESEGSALSDSSAVANATAIGIEGGLGSDTIINYGGIFAAVGSDATAVSADLNVGLSIKEGGNATGAALSDAGVTAASLATGIDGGGDADDIGNRGAIRLVAQSDAVGVAAGLDIAGSATFEGKATGDVEGKAASDTHVKSAATVTGMVGGDGNDTINNEGGLDLFQAEANATGVSASLNIAATGSFKGDSEGNAAGQALSDSSVTAMAAATAIEGDAGNDIIGNTSNFVAVLSNSDATGVSASLDIAGSVAFKGDVSGEVEGTALSDADTASYSGAKGIDGGDGNDIIVNDGNFNLLRAESDATGVAASLNVAAGLAVQGGANVDVSGAAISDAKVTAQAVTVAIEGGAGDDEITNTGDFINLTSDSTATGVAASLDIAGSVAFKGENEGDISGAALSDTSVTAEAAAVGIDGGEGRDTIINEGDIASLSAKSDATGVAASLSTTAGVSFKDDAKVNATGKAVSKADVRADSFAVGIAAGEGNDTIINTGDIVGLEAGSSATGVAAGLNFTSVLAINGNAQADIEGEAIGDSSVTARATALGLDGGLGDDQIDNEGDIRLLSTADATGVTAELNVSAALSFKGASTADVSGSAASNTSVAARAIATGIEGGGGKDKIRNSGNITLMDQDTGVDEVDASALGVSASLNVSGNVAIKGVAAGDVTGTAASNATVLAEAEATGIDGGGDNDDIANNGTIKLLPSSSADGIAASLNVSGNMVGESEGSSMSDAGATALSTAIGIDGGEGNDIISNEGAIILMKQELGEDEADAKAIGVAASLDITGNLNGSAEGQALSKAITTAGAEATGIDGAGGSDIITNTAGITADVDSHAEGVAVAAEVTVGLNGTAEGSSLSDVSTTANSEATGIEGGDDDDIIDNSGLIRLFSDADATSTAVSVTVAGTLRGQAGGEALSKATTTAEAEATGISGDDGMDEITNRGKISAAAHADTDTVAVTVGITVAAEGEAEGAALSDSSSVSFAQSTGIDGGGNDDSIINEGEIDITSLADAQATAVSVGLTGAMKGLAEGKSVADSSAEAISQSIGIYGGEGNDTITSSANPISTFARSLTDAESVSIQGTGAVGMASGAAVAESSASSIACSAGIDGGLGNDTIDNASEIKSTAKADARSDSTSVGVTIGAGAADTIGVGDSSATAQAIVTGIEGGGDDDNITNTAAITVGGLETMGLMADAGAESTTVTVGIAAGLNMSEASSDASALAEVEAAGISGGSGDDRIFSAGDITVGGDPMGTGGMANADSRSTTVDISVTAGASLGESSSDTSATAVVTAAGIRGGSGNDDITNTGSITVGSDFSDPAKTDAMAKAKAASETIDIGITIGGSFGDASSDASATAMSTVAGIETGQGGDRIFNTGPINAFSSSEAVGIGETTSVSLMLGASEGGAESDASALATSLATGIDGGGDGDEITTDNAIVVKARSKSTAVSTASNYNILSVGAALQSASADSSSTAETIARGIDGGTGGDIITAGGTLDVTADSFVTGSSRSSTVTGLGLGVNVQEARAKTETVADSLAIGIDGGEGDDYIHSTVAMSLNAYSGASTQAISATNTGFNIAGASSGESMAGAATDVIAAAIGIRGGKSGLDPNETDADVIISEGPITVASTTSATTESISTADSITVFGSAAGKAVSDASATVRADATGIESGADSDTITSSNALTVTAAANGSVTSTSNVDSDVVFGGASSKGVSDASADVAGEATGIDGGDGMDVITNAGLITVDATSTGSVSATSNVNADVTFGSASSKAVSDASAVRRMESTGIIGGNGMDVITNNGALRVTATSDGTVSSSSYSNADATFGTARSAAFATAGAEGSAFTTGITGGGDGDMIENVGYLDSIAESTLVVASSSVSISDSTFGDAYAAAFTASSAQGKAAATGISGDAGNDIIENNGAVNATATADTTVRSTTIALADSTFGDAHTVAASSNFAAADSCAKGITAGSGNDEIMNTSLVTVEAGGTVTVHSLTVSGSGPAYSDARTLALAHASGVDTGAGDDEIANTDTVFVKAAPRVVSATRTFGSGGNVDGKVGILLNAGATGLTGGEGNDTINNEGNVLVFAGGPETASTVSEQAGSGLRTLVDQSLVTESAQELEGKWIRISGGENPDFFTQIMAFDPLTGRLTLRDPITYDLSPGATYTIYDYGDKEADITEVTVTVGGRTTVDASTTASVRAKGIAGGNGDDEIVNSGSVSVSARNLIESVNVTLGGNIDVDTRIASGADAVGIEGSDRACVSDSSNGGTNTFTDISRKGEDPAAIIGRPVLIQSGASAGFLTTVEAFDSETGTFTLAESLPSGGILIGDIYTLGGGSDTIINLGTIDVAANSAIDATSWSLNFGEADIQTRGRADAVSVGMRGGQSGDSFGNYGDILTQSTAGVSSTDRVYVVFGNAEQNLFFEASSDSLGVDMGSGDDEFFNAEEGSIHAEAVSTADVDGVTAVFFSSTTNSVDAIADAIAWSLDLGQGNNVAFNAGDLLVSSQSTVAATAAAEYDRSETDADADAIAQAYGWGVQAGDEEDHVFNSGLIRVEASADSTSYARGAVIGSPDDTSTVTGDSASGSTTFVDASLIGQPSGNVVGKWVRFLTGDNADFYTRIEAFDSGTGTITLAQGLPGDLKALEVDDEGEVITPADQYTFSAARDGSSSAVATAVAKGIELGNGNAIVENSGQLVVKASADADTTAASYCGAAAAEAEARAEAGGIVTGDGNDVVRNEGTIRVEAEAVTSASGSSVRQSITAIAAGIDTGGGDDTIRNDGSIITTVSSNDADPVPGIGITSGDGNDEVILGDRSLVDGSIDLGIDDDSLMFIGSAGVTRAVDAGTGTDDLIFDGEGAVDVDLLAFETATKQGAGTFTLADLTTMHRITVHQGTLAINDGYGDGYRFADDGLFEIRINGDGTHGKLVFAGDTDLGGTLRVFRGPGVYINGITFDVLEAGNYMEGDRFSAELLPEPTALLSFGTNYLEDDTSDIVEVEVQAKSFTTVATNDVELKIARYLDQIAPSATGDLSLVLGEIQLLSGDEFSEAFSSLSPDLYDKGAQVTFANVRNYVQVLQQRMNHVRESSSPVESGSDHPLLAYNGPDAELGRFLSVRERTSEPRRYDLWLQGFRQWGDQDGDVAHTGYDYWMGGATLGLDYLLTDWLLAGINIGYSYTDINLDRNRGDGDIRSTYGSLYGMFFKDRFYAEGALTCGVNDYNNDRAIQIGGIRRNANSDYDGNVWSAALGAGYTVPLNAWMLRFFGSLQYARLDEESFEESGADDLNLRIGDRQTDFLVSELGLRLRREFSTRNGRFLPEVSVGWKYDYDIDDQIVTTSFAGSPNVAFRIEGQDAEQNALVLGAGLTFQHKGGLGTSLRYNGELRDDYCAHGIIGEIMYRF